MAYNNPFDNPESPFDYRKGYYALDALKRSAVARKQAADPANAPWADAQSMVGPGADWAPLFESFNVMKDYNPKSTIKARLGTNEGSALGQAPSAGYSRSFMPEAQNTPGLQLNPYTPGGPSASVMRAIRALAQMNTPEGRKAKAIVDQAGPEPWSIG